jgi:hypothetical protein
MPGTDKDQTKPEIKENNFDTEDHYNDTIKEILEATDTEANSRQETEIKEEPEEKEEDKEEPEKVLVEKPEFPDEKKEEEGNKALEILGKTPEEIDEIINQRTLEAVKKHEDTLKDYYESQKNEMNIHAQMGQIEQLYNQYEQSVVHIDQMLNDGQITAQQYKEAVNIAVNDMNYLKQNYYRLQQYNQQAELPKIKRLNDEFYQQLEGNLPEFKDPIVNKYAKNLKEKIFDVGGIDMAKGGFTDYVRDFIAAAVQEGEIRGYQKVKNELQKSNAKAKAKSAVQQGGNISSKSPIRTAEDIDNASADDLLKFVLN